MTENEKKSICGLNFLKEKLYNGIYADRLDCIDSAIYALKEIQQYRKIGTVEACREAVKEEDALKFYYCESEDDYYIGKRVGNFYYARYGETGFEWFMSRYLPWGEHVIAPNTLWKEHIYPSEPKEIPFFEWLQGFIKRYCGGTVEECREAMANKKKCEKQWHNDTENPLEPIKVYSALKSEILKLELRIKNRPKDISVLDYTVIAALQKVLKNNLEGTEDENT